MITMVLTKGRQEGQNQRRCDNGSKSERQTFEDATQALKREGEARGRGEQVASRKAGKETHSPLEPPGGKQPC